MAKVIITCGKICSGKSFYSNKIKDELNATCEKLGMEVWIQRKEIFDKMHNV